MYAYGKGNVTYGICELTSKLKTRTLLIILERGTSYAFIRSPIYMYSNQRTS